MNSQKESKELPQGWCHVKFEDIISQNISQGIPESVEKITYIDISAIDNKSKKITAPKQYDRFDAPSRARQQVCEGDILVASTRPNLNAVAIIPKELNGAIASSGFIVLRPVKILTEWVFAVVQSRDFVESMTELTKGALYPAIRAKDVYNYSLPIPPIEEQARIVKWIQEQNVKHEKLSLLLAEVLSDLPTYRTAILHYASIGNLFVQSGELDNYEKTANNRVQLLNDGSCKSSFVIDENSKAPTPFPDWTISDQQPSDWQQKTLGDLVIHIHAGKSIQTEERPAEPDEWGIIKVSAISYGKFDDTENKAVPFSYEPNVEAEIKVGDLLLSRSNTPELVGANAFVFSTRSKLLLSDKSLRLVPSTEVDAEWLHYILSSPRSRNQLTKKASGASGSMVNISQANLCKIEILSPPLSQQKQIASEVRRRLAVLEKITEELHAANDCLSLHRFAILERALNGQSVLQSSLDTPAAKMISDVAILRNTSTSTPRRATKKKRGSKKDVLAVLREYPEGVPPEVLLKLSGYSKDEIPEFYKLLRAEKGKLEVLQVTTKRAQIKSR